MTPEPFLSEFEIYVMSAIARLGDDAYGMTILREIEVRTSRQLAVGAVYAALARLTDKGLVANELQAPLPIKGGEARVTDRPGLGVELDDEKVDRYRVK